MSQLRRIIKNLKTVVGANAPVIADHLILEAFPETRQAADREGAMVMLRIGIVAYLAQSLKRDAGTDSEISVPQQFDDIAKKLSNPSHYVPSEGQYIPAAHLLATPEKLDEARKFKRQKGLETFAVADALDELYEAVTGRA